MSKRSPKPYERRAAGSYPFYRLGVWEARSFTYRDRPATYENSGDAKAAATRNGPGKYRITTVGEAGVMGFEDYVVPSPPTLVLNDE